MNPNYEIDKLIFEISYLQQCIRTIINVGVLIVRFRPEVVEKAEEPHLTLCGYLKNVYFEAKIKKGKIGTI